MRDELRQTDHISAFRVVPWFAFVLAVTLAVRAYQPTGWLGSDDAAYYSAAEHILTGTPITRAHHHYARTAVVLPVAASVAIFGHHPWAVALPTFVASIACVILVIALGRLLFGWREGLLAGLVVAVLPYFRVLSTTAYPDTHVCFWTTASVLCFVLALRTGRTPDAPFPGAGKCAASAKSARLLLLASGFALGLAISCKVFAATAVFGLGFLLLQAHRLDWRRVLSNAGLLLAGWLVFFVLEGFFFHVWAGDFLFALHAHEQSQAGVPEMAAETAASAIGLNALVKERMSLMFQVFSSGWGWLGVAFWPAIFLGLVVRRSRAMSVWAAATFLLISFFPVSLAGGYQPYPIFHGRHVLPACVPFALCFSFVICVCIARFEAVLQWLARTPPRRVLWASPSVSWCAVAVLVVIVSFNNPRELKGFRDRPTGRVGQALQALAAQDIWQGDQPIVMTPSTYWRYRIMFPEPLRSRLRVAVADGSPDWWRDVAPGIEDRLAPLPWPGKAYLVATLLQLEGRAESWDYGVALPADPLALWRNAVWLGVRRDGEFATTNAPWSLSGSIVDAVAVGVTIGDIPLHDRRCSCMKDPPISATAHLLRDGVNQP